MPTYEFRCTAGHLFEQFFRSIGSAPSAMACPQCGQPSERLISGGAGLHFKGSGFYLTDYGKNAHQKKGPADAKSSEKGESGASDGATPAAKSESASSNGASGDEPAKSDKKPDSKPAESKPAATPPKSSSGE